MNLITPAPLVSLVSGGVLAMAMTAITAAEPLTDPVLTISGEPIDLTNELVCGEQLIRFGFRDGEMRLQVGDQAFDLRQAVSASGARYVALADPQTWVWIKGDRATFQRAGQTYPECTPVATGPSALRATGNEPAWSLEIDQTHVLLVKDLGETRIRVALTDPEPVEGGIRYDNLVEDGELTITLLDRVCRDSMSGMPHPKRVEISLDGVALEGCGGDPASLLQGGEWVVEDIAGGGIIDRSRVTLDFGADGALSGGASCNRYHSHYELTGEGLTIAQAASTRMACAPALMHQEQVFFELLARTKRFELDDDGALRLHTDDGRSLLARREID
jgi:heat shock protein HslJ